MAYPTRQFQPYDGAALLAPGSFKPERGTVSGRPHADASSRPFVVDKAVFDSPDAAAAVGLPPGVATVRRPRE
ncbi:MAG: hypothetical protein A3J93_03285 [Candidatus Magasanikbacteria bacterium RIFOXYC2_FULL_42_28]|uniref:Uncharacterized protein n=1 Tax=Candidatus Magasanikbacteria bacterium RIFOXYC2_FULL_42_28 TaxID=1798704 RepID=A0A1F6NUD6_9BACT|nr:MAG: hypothetical protein A3J93_03285 [Candidatus Magasanikbacteria bacterium RIFOXYC2_FULL_42_28]